MRKIITLIENQRLHFAYERNHIPQELWNEDDIVNAVRREHIKADTPITVFNGTQHKVMRASEVEEIAKHLPPAPEPREFFTFENKGFPQELHDAKDVQRAISKGDLTPDTKVTAHMPNQKPFVKAAKDFPHLAKHFEEVPADHQLPPETGAKRIRVTRALDAISGADITSPQGAEAVLKAVHSICDSVLSWVEHRGEIALAARKAVGEAKTYFPRSADNLMQNPQSMRNIRDGLQLIRDALKNYNVVMEAENLTESDWYDRRHELEPGMVFRDFEGDLVKLDERVEGDGTKWRVALWWSNSWSYDGSTIEPGDLRGEPLPDPANKA